MRAHLLSLPPYLCLEIQIVFFWEKRHSHNLPSSTCFFFNDLDFCFVGFFPILCHSVIRLNVYSVFTLLFKGEKPVEISTKNPLVVSWEEMIAS